MPRAPVRKSHKKSRAGCKQCKRRHLKCDETKPRCVNCQTHDLLCPYEADDVSTQQQPSPAVHAAPTPRAAPTPLTLAGEVHSLSTPSSIINHGSPFPYTADGLNMLHLELFYKWISETSISMTHILKPVDVYRDISVECSLQFAFLMKQILATAALHSSCVRADRRRSYHQTAIQLQADALEGFHSIVSRLNDENTIAAFMFASMIGMHAFCETFSYRQGTFNDVSDALLRCISLLRGVRAVIAGSWPQLQDSRLAPILADAAEHVSTRYESFTFNELRDMVDECDVGNATKSAYHDTIKELEISFRINAAFEANDPQVPSRSMFRWFVIMPKLYLDHLTQRRPEALVLLAYYAVVLHSCRKLWSIGDAGSYLITSIHIHLGRHWERWLAYPLRCIEDVP